MENDALKAWIKQAGTTQGALAGKLGVTQGRISQIIRGGTPSPALAVKLARHTGISVHAFRPDVAELLTEAGQ